MKRNTPENTIKLLERCLKLEVQNRKSCTETFVDDTLDVCRRAVADPSYDQEVRRRFRFRKADPQVCYLLWLKEKLGGTYKLPTQFLETGSPT